MQLLQLPECKDFVALAFEKAAMLPAEEYQEFLGMVKATLQAARGNYDILGLPTKPGWWSVRWKGEAKWKAGEVYASHGTNRLFVLFDWGHANQSVDSNDLEFGCELHPGPVETLAKPG